MKIYKLKQFIKKIDHYIQKEAKKLPLTDLDGPQGQVICYLKKHQNRKIYQKDIEVLLDINKSGASQLISRMVKNGFVIEKQSQTDKRYKELQLTSKGEQHVNTIQQFANKIDSDLVVGLSKEDIAHFYKVIEIVEFNMNKKVGE